MVNEKIIDYGTFLASAIIGAILQLQPQILGVYGLTPQDAVLITLAMLVLSQIGSRLSVKMARTEVPPQVQEKIDAIIAENEALTEQVQAQPEPQVLEEGA